MTTTEFSNQFDIHFDSIATNSAPGIDLYEKSVYFTKAQLEIIKNYYRPLGNKYKEGFESSEKRRSDLRQLITQTRVNSSTNSINGISNDSKFFTIPNNVFIILSESVILNSDDLCVNNKRIKVVPKTHDEYNIQINNPFKKPDDSIVWRIDYSNQNTNKNVELISPFNLSDYIVRYIKYPEPIILTDLSAGEFAGEGLSIDGITQEQTCQLDEEIHQEILDRAVFLAVADYKDSTLNARVLSNSNNE